MRRDPIATDQISDLINTVHSTLNSLGQDGVEETASDSGTIGSALCSARPHHLPRLRRRVKCLRRTCSLRHGSVTQYKLRWRLASDHPMTAPNYSEQRSQFARKIGLGRKPSLQGSRPAAPSVTTLQKPPLRRAVTKAVRSRNSAHKTRPVAKKANTRTTARKATPINATRKTNARKTSVRTAGKTASNRSRSR